MFARPNMCDLRELILDRCRLLRGDMWRRARCVVCAQPYRREINITGIGLDTSGLYEGSSGRSWWRCGRIDQEEREYQAATLARLEAMKRGETGAPQATQPEATEPMQDVGRASREGPYSKET